MEELKTVLLVFGILLSLPILIIFMAVGLWITDKIIKGLWRLLDNEL